MTSRSKLNPVSSDNLTPEYIGQPNQLPVLVELVGLAGTGKSTLTREISAFRGAARGIDYETECLQHHLAHAGYTIKHLLRLAPTLVKTGKGVTGMTREDLKKMLYLDGWHRIFDQQRRQANIILSDQGAVFCLATLYGFGPAMLRKERLSCWWARRFDNWAGHIDVIIRLKCPYEVLVNRINDKPKHIVKGKEKSEMIEFLARYDAAFDHVLLELGSRRPIRLLEFDTNQQSRDETVSQIAAQLGLDR